MDNDRASINEIYIEHSKTIYRYLLSMTHEESLAEELMQETFYQAIRCLSKYDGTCKITTWLCAIAKNQWRNYCKKHHAEEALLDENLTECIPSAEETAFTVRSKIEIMKALHRLKEPQREVIYLRLSADLSFREIGEIMGRTENWARVTYYRGKEKLIEEVNIRE